MPRGDATTPVGRASRFVMLASICVIVAALYFAQDVLIPLALAVLLTFLLTPMVMRLERRHVGRVPSVIIVVTLAVGLVIGIGMIMFFQLEQLANDLPSYRTNIQTKLARVMPGREGMIWKIQKATQDVSQAATSQPADGTSGPHPPGSAKNPLYVQLSDQTISPLRALVSTLGKVLAPLGTAGIVVIFTIFMLLSREDLRDRLIRLVGHGRLNVTTQALNDAGQRISRYLLMQSIVNGTYGVAISLGLWVIGVPNPLLFGLLCALLRFIPYVGPWIGAAFPIIVSLGKFAGFRELIETGVLFVGVELLSNNFMEPWLYGSSTGISTVAVLVAAVFWTWLWGPVGLLLSTPLTVVLVVMGKYVPQLAFLDILLGDEPVLEPPERVYQRLLALDQEEATDLLRQYKETMTLEQVYDDVLLPALAMAEQDRHRGELDEKRENFVRRAMRDIIDELGDAERGELARSAAQATEDAAKDDRAAVVAAESGDGKPAAPVRATLPENCTLNITLLPAHDEADEIVNLMLAQLLVLRGYCAESVSVNALASEMLEKIQQMHANAVIVSALPPAAVAHARYLCKRVQSRFSDQSMIVGLWTYKGDLRRTKERIACDPATPIVTTLQQALEDLDQMVQPMLAAASQDSAAASQSSQPTTRKSQRSSPAPKKRK